MNKNLEKIDSYPDLFLLSVTCPKQRQIYISGYREEQLKTDLHRGRPGGGREETRILKFDLAGGERLVLHDDGAAGGQDHDVELLLLLMGLLVPVTGHLRVVGGDQRHLRGRQRSGKVTTDTAERRSAGRG